MVPAVHEKEDLMQKSMSIMLVDDEERFLVTTGKLISRMGYAVVTAAGGAEALDKLRTHEVHVVILDVKMPGMDGLAALKEIKLRYPMVEVIMLTGHATMESAIEGLKSGASDYLMKPTDIPELIRKAEAAYQRRQELENRIRGAHMRRHAGSPRDE
jgi:DNA-binding NtrC family response regulator